MNKILYENLAIEWILAIKEKIKKESFLRYWPDFTPFPFAFYDDHQVYLCNHPSPPEGFRNVGEFFQGPRDSRFFGNTSIMLEGVPTAIVDLTLLTPDNEIAQLFSLIVHEMYHSYQHSVGYQRGSNEFLYLRYPQTKENIALRLMERKALLSALFTQEKTEKLAFVDQFFAYRESRRKRIGDYLTYELGQESVEGLATYVESKAYREGTGLPEPFLLGHFCKNLYEPQGTLFDLRKSCYSSGLAISYLLDDFIPDWKREYMASSSFLYDYFLGKMERKISVDDPPVDPETERKASFLFQKETDKRDGEFAKFYSSKGYLITIEGSLKIQGFDPMNLLPKGNQLLHKRFLKVLINGDTFVFNQSCVTQMTGEGLDCNKLQFFTPQLPEMLGETIQIGTFPPMKGTWSQEGREITIKLS